MPVSCSQPIFLPLLLGRAMTAKWMGETGVKQHCYAHGLQSCKLKAAIAHSWKIRRTGKHRLSQSVASLPF